MPCTCWSRERVGSSRGFVLAGTAAQGGGRSVVWDPPASVTGVEENVLRTLRSSSSPPAESMDCNRKPGFYYDELLKHCISCSTVCGQHPKQCATSCESKVKHERGRAGTWGRTPRAGLEEDMGYGSKAREGAANPHLFVLGSCSCADTALGAGRSKAGRLPLSCFLQHTAFSLSCVGV